MYVARGGWTMDAEGSGGAGVGPPNHYRSVPGGEYPLAATSLHPVCVICIREYWRRTTMEEVWGGCASARLPTRSS